MMHRKKNKGFEKILGERRLVYELSNIPSNSPEIKPETIVKLGDKEYYKTKNNQWYHKDEKGHSVYLIKDRNKELIRALEGNAPVNEMNTITPDAEALRIWRKALENRVNMGILPRIFRGETELIKDLKHKDIIKLAKDSPGFLASLFVNNFDKTKGIEEGKEYSVNFNGNETANAIIGLGDMLSSDFREVWIDRNDGEGWIKGVRDIYQSKSGTKKIGYVDENGNYLEIFGLENKYKFKALKDVTKETENKFQVAAKTKDKTYNKQTLGVIKDEKNIKDEIYTDIITTYEKTEKEVQKLKEAKDPKQELASKSPQEIWELRSNLGVLGMRKLIDDLNINTKKPSEQLFREKIKKIVRENKNIDYPKDIENIMIGILRVESRGGYQFEISDTGALGPWQIIKDNYYTDFPSNPFDIYQSTKCALNVFMRSYKSKTLRDTTILKNIDKKEACTRTEKAIMAYFAGENHIIKDVTRIPEGNTINAIKYLEKWYAKKDSPEKISTA